jgi:molybdenum cofactor cytidylyltransferase
VTGTRSGNGGVAGIVLAAGQSRRLGRPKQLLELDGRPILDIVLQNASESLLTSVLLVLGSEADRISATVGNHGQQVVINPDYAQGQSTSLRRGIAALGNDVAGALVLLGDQPHVAPAVINRLIAAFADSGAEIVQPVYGGTPGNPVLFRRSAFPELLEITGDRGAREVIKQKRDAVHRVPFPDLSVPLDVDTDEDYRRLRAAWPERG